MRLQQGGVLVLISPYSWLEEYTPKVCVCFFVCVCASLRVRVSVRVRVRVRMRVRVRVPLFACAFVCVWDCFFLRVFSYLPAHARMRNLNQQPRATTL